MPWVRVDDHFDEHPKHAKAGPLGIALWLAGLAYCNRNLTNGNIPWAVAQRLLTWQFLGEPEEDGRRKVYTIGVSCGMSGEDVTCEFVIPLLVNAGLWEEVDGGFYVHDYPDYQFTRDEIEAFREAGKRGGLAKGKAKAKGYRLGQGKANPLTTPTPTPTPLDPSASSTAAPGVEVDDKYGAFCRLYEGNVGTLGPLIASRLAELADEFTVEWFEAAVQEAVGNNAHSLKYIEAILERWKRDGFKVPIGGAKGRGNGPRPSGGRAPKQLPTAEQLKGSWGGA